ncbi:MAG: 16S rRNA (uracil(1498)-N(3))-methyltransferase [Syntrophomonadaceae bacterium]|nr:16S rRNA (uracil(1498)-N(3))-methyltransferase [Syntrophomonadaceae bacterium]
MRRFYVAQQNITDTIVSITGEEAHHIANVLRMHPDESIIIFDGSGWDYEIRLQSISSRLVTGHIISRTLNSAEPPLSITLVQGLAKGEKMDFIIQKAVEVGVNRIIPIHCDYSVVRLEGKKPTARVERWNRMAIEACKQCGRSQPPPVEMVSGLEDVLKKTADRPRIIFYEQSKERGLNDIINQHRRLFLEQGLTVFVGPEGGFSPAEVHKVQEAGGWIAGLGPRILRTETAGLVALSILMWELGDLRA